MSKYEQLIEFIINEQEDKARELFHQIVVEKSREIYESIIDEEDLEEIGGNPVEAMMDEVTADETGMAEADEEMDMEIGADEEGDMDMDMEVDADSEDEGDMDMDMDMGADESPEMAISDAKSEVDEIFDRLMSQLSGEGEEEMSMDMDSDEDMDMMEASHEDEEDEEDEEDLQESKHAKKEEMLKAKDAKGKRKMTEAEWLREYVDQIGDVYGQEPAQEEGHEVGAGKKVKVDKDSTAVGPGVDMGGKVVKTKGSEQNPDNKQTPEPSNEYTKGRGNLPHAGKFQNVPGAKTKPSNSGKPEYSKAHGAEGQTTSGKVAVTAKSPVAKA